MPRRAELSTQPNPTPTTTHTHTHDPTPPTPTTYHTQALRVSLTCAALRHRWPALRDGLETVTLDPSPASAAACAFSPRRFFQPLLASPSPSPPCKRRGGKQQAHKGQPLHPMRRLRCLVVRGGPVALLTAAEGEGDSELPPGGGNNNRGGGRGLLGGGMDGEERRREAAEAWRLTPPVLRGLRGLFPRLVELDLGA